MAKRFYAYFGGQINKNRRLVLVEPADDDMPRIIYVRLPHPVGELDWDECCDAVIVTDTTPEEDSQIIDGDIELPHGGMASDFRLDEN